MRSLLISILMILSLCLSAQRTLSDSSYISVLTCGAGEELYSLFGHTAVRVVDQEQDFDYVFNYGTFEFGNSIVVFGLKFLSGKLPYKLDVSTFDTFLVEYQYEKRYVKEQILDLHLNQRNAIFAFLQENLKKENRYYKYDFFFDNCTTRVRDVIADRVSATDYPETPSSAHTFREMIQLNVEDRPWLQFGMDLILGAKTDRQTAVTDQMFLPAYFFKYLEDTQHGDRALLATTRTILDFPEVSRKKPLLTPSVVFGALLIFELILFFLVYISGDERWVKVLDRVWFIGLFICFLIFMIMWFLTDHQVCERNWNLLWTLPWMPFIFRKGSRMPWQKALITLSLIVSVWVASQVGISQYMSTAIIFISLISAVKSARMLGAGRWLDRYIKHGATAVLLTLVMTGSLSSQDKIGGITLVAPPRPFDADPMTRLAAINTTWVALVPFGFTRPGTAEVRYDGEHQWWGEREEGIVKSIELARKNGLKIMLKPQVWMRGSWVGDMDYEEESDWLSWEESYRKYIMQFVDMAVEHEVELFCIGTEFRKSATKREEFWRKLIKKVREKYRGKITYSANWDDYHNVPFWDALDFVGISAYFPLTESETPSVNYLSVKWRSIVSKLRRYARRQGRRILFTEYGYLSVDGAAGKTWELEKQVDHLNLNEAAQANALEALYSSWVDEDFWAGGFLWKWFPESLGHEGYLEKDYTPQDKEAEEVIRKWYGQLKR